MRVYLGLGTYASSQRRILVTLPICLPRPERGKSPRFDDIFRAYRRIMSSWWNMGLAQFYQYRLDVAMHPYDCSNVVRISRQCC